MRGYMHEFETQRIAILGGLVERQQLLGGRLLDGGLLSRDLSDSLIVGHC